MTDINQIELTLWTEELRRAKGLMEMAKEEADNDPMNELIDVQVKFQQLLENNPGKARHTKLFTKAISELSIREKRAKMRSNKYDLIKVLDIYNESRMYYNTILNKWNSVKYRHDMRSK